MAARPLVLLLALAALLAGCVSSAPPPGGSPPPGTSAAPGFAPDCTISNWGDACTARASPNESPSKTEIDLAVNPTDPSNVFVASKDLDRSASNCVWSVGQVTKDAGRTWTTVYAGGTLEDRALPTHPLFGWSCITDPILAFDAAGVLYYPLQAYNYPDTSQPNCVAEGAPIPLPVGVLSCGSAFFLATSTDGGATFPTDRIIPMAIAEGSLVFHDYPRMLVNPRTQTVSTVWNAVGNAGVNPYVVSTRDQGRTVDPPTIVAAPTGPRTTAFASGFTADSAGAVYMTVYIIDITEGGGGEAQPVYLAVSTDDARTFGGFGHMFDVTPIDCPLPNTEFRCGTSIELAADTSGGPRDGRLYAVWDDGREGHADVYAAWSDDQGATWSEPVRVNQDTTTHAQWMARADVGPDGTLHVLYMDRAFDPGDRLYDATHAWSTDGGLTWQNRRLTSVSSDGDLGVHQNGFPFIGDYNGIDVVGEHVWMGFPSTVTGVAEIAMAHVVQGGAGSAGNATAPAA